MENISAIIKNLQDEYEDIKEEYEVISKKAEDMRNKLNSLDGAIKNLRSAYGVNVSFGLPNSNNENRSVTKMRRTKFNGKRTFESVIAEILNRYGHPLTSRQLQDNYNNLVEVEDRKDRNTFSGMISHIYTKKNQIDRTELPEIKGRSKFVYGLPEWFDKNGNLKEEFIEKIRTETDLFTN